MKRKIKYLILTAIVIILTAYVLFQYSVMSGGIIERKSDFITVLSDWSPLNGFSEYDGLAIECSYKKTNVDFSAYACDGSFGTRHGELLESITEYYSSMSIANNQVLTWVCVPENEGTWWNGTKTYAEITMLENEHITGYAVVMIECDQDICEYRAQVIKCVDFPRKINGEYQQVSTEQVNAAMEKVEQKFSE